MPSSVARPSCDAPGMWSVRAVVADTAASTITSTSGDLGAISALHTRIGRRSARCAALLLCKVDSGKRRQFCSRLNVRRNAMRLISLGVVATALALSSSVSAQNLPQPWADPEDRPPHVDVSASAGVLMPTNWSSLVLLGSISSASGILEQVLSRELRVQTDKAYSGAVTYWEGRYGFRVQADYSRSSLKISSAPLGAPSGQSGTSLKVPVKTWLYDARGVIAFVEHDQGRKVL